MKRCITILAAVLFLMASTAWSGPLKNASISADANWVVHINNAQFARTEIGKSIRSELGTLGIEQKLAGFAEIFGFHPLDDLENITLYGTGPDESKAVAIAQGKFDAEKLIALVSVNPMHEEIPHGSVIVHKWLDEKNTGKDGTHKTMYGSILKGRTVILSRGLTAVEKAIDVLDGSADSAADSLNRSVLKARGAFIQIAATDVAGMTAEQGEAAMLKKAKSLGVAVGEVDAKFYVEASLTADTAEAAQAIGKMVDGMIAFMSLSQQERPQLAQLAKAAKLSYKDNSVNLRLEVGSDKVIAFLKEQWQKEAQKKNAPQQ